MRSNILENLFATTGIIKKDNIKKKMKKIDNAIINRSFFNNLKKYMEKKKINKNNNIVIKLISILKFNIDSNKLINKLYIQFNFR